MSVGNLEEREQQEGRGGAQGRGHGMLSTLCTLRICQDIPISFGGLSWDEVGNEETWPVCSQGNTALAASSAALGRTPVPFKKE